MTGHKEEIARRLSEARLAAGLTLRDIAASLRIKPVYLQAIEAGQFDRLPALPQTIGFTRAYAKHLDVDLEAPLSRLGEEVHQHIENADYSGPEPIWTVSPRRIGYTVAGMFIGAGLLALAVFDLPFAGNEPIAPASVDRLASPLPPAAVPVVRSVTPVLENAGVLHGATPRLAAAPITADFAFQLAAATAISASTAERGVAAAAGADELAGQGEAYRFVTGHVYMRARPANAGAVLDVLEPCERVVLLNDDGAGQWLNISREDESSGWVYRNYLGGDKPASCS